MANVDAKQVLHNLYGLMMEINYHRPKEEFLAELQAKPDAHIEKHLIKIKQITAKLKAHENRHRFDKAVEQIKLLREKGLDELKRFIHPQEHAQLMPLFNKFQELTNEDEAAILEDQELLLLIEVLKDRIDESPK